LWATCSMSSNPSTAPAKKGKKKNNKKPKAKPQTAQPAAVEKKQTAAPKAAEQPAAVSNANGVVTAPAQPTVQPVTANGEVKAVAAGAAGSEPVPVPNVTSKLSEKEQAKLQAQLGNMQKVAATLFVLGAENETKEWQLAKKETDLKQVPTCYFKNCTNGKYTIGANHRTVKVLIEGCKNTTFTFDGDILTRTVEVWRCEGCQFNINTQVKTLQLDLSSNMQLRYKEKDHFGSIVWAAADELQLSFADAKQHDLRTGFKEMVQAHPDSKKDLDQFIIRFVDDKLLPERCIRLKNGFLSTEREALDWEKRNEVKKQQYLDDFFKNSGVHLKKAKDATKKVSPNAECPCGSGKKHKKCCMNKKELSGTEEPKKAVV